MWCRLRSATAARGGGVDPDTSIQHETCPGRWGEIKNHRREGSERPRAQLRSAPETGRRAVINDVTGAPSPPDVLWLIAVAQTLRTGFAIS
jgi:hypothetical protein